MELSTNPTRLTKAPSSPLAVEPAPAPRKPEVLTHKEQRLADGINWYVAIWLTLLHVGAISALWFFSWQAVVLTVVLHWITGGLGICLGFHRLLTHSSFQTYRPVKWLFAWLGGLAGEGAATDWVADHRKHHAHSDQDGDPHSPDEGAWWSHMPAGCMRRFTVPTRRRHDKRWAPDLLKDPVMGWIGDMFLPSQFLLGFALFGLGWWIGGSYMAWSFVIWGMFVAAGCSCCTPPGSSTRPATFGATAITKRPTTAATTGGSALISYGEGWHNNHHAYPRMANHGHKWWEFDLTYLAILLLQTLGLAWNVVDYKRKSELTNDDAEQTAA